MEVELVKMKGSYKEPQDGDVFVLQPKKGIYYYGKVIQSNVVSKDAFISGMYLIYIYDLYTSEKKSNINLDEAPLLIAPMVVNKRPWTMGYFETISKSSVTDYDCSIDYGFWDVIRKNYYDLQGNLMSHKPKYSGTFGLGSFGAIAYEVHEALSKKNNEVR